MRITAAALILCATSFANAADNTLPIEVRNFVAERKICDHFRDEPYEGGTPDLDKRREFVIESLDIYCSGTDKRLAALKKRYKNNKDVMQYLNKYDEHIE